MKDTALIESGFADKKAAEYRGRGITKRGIMYWIIQRVQVGGAPMGGAPTIPDLDRGLIEDIERVGRLPK